MDILLQPVFICLCSGDVILFVHVLGIRLFPAPIRINPGRQKQQIRLLHFYHIFYRILLQVQVTSDYQCCFIQVCHIICRVGLCSIVSINLWDHVLISTHPVSIRRIFCHGHLSPLMCLSVFFFQLQRCHLTTFIYDHLGIRIDINFNSLLSTNLISRISDCKQRRPLHIGSIADKRFKHITYDRSVLILFVSVLQLISPAIFFHIPPEFTV